MFNVINSWDIIFIQELNYSGTFYYRNTKEGGYHSEIFKPLTKQQMFLAI